MTRTKKVTQRQANHVLRLVADWMSQQSGGQPVPTGEDAAYRGLGPMLNMNWDWPSQPTPTVLLEGGPEDWAIRCCSYVQTMCDLKEMDLFVEPYAAYALCIYREDS